MRRYEGMSPPPRGVGESVTFHTRAEERAPPQPEAYRECALVLPIQIPAVKDVEGLGPGSRSGEQPPVLVKGSGLKGFEPLIYRCPSDAPKRACR